MGFCFGPLLNILVIDMFFIVIQNLKQEKNYYILFMVLIMIIQMTQEDWLFRPLYLFLVVYCFIGGYLTYLDHTCLHHFLSLVFSYLVYDWFHYASHHMTLKNKYFRMLVKHHLLHHYRDPENGFGFTTTAWDKILNTMFKK